MAIVMVYRNPDEIFHITERKILLNKMSLAAGDTDNIKKLIYSQYEKEVSLIPQCECGYLNKAYQLGETCPVCNTTVIHKFDIIKPLLWIEQFDPEIPFLNVEFWTQLRVLISKKVDVVRWLCDTSYNPPIQTPIVHNLASIIGKRGYVNFINNIDKVLLYLKNNSTFRNNHKDKKVEELLNKYKENKNKLFSRYIPAINKRLFVMEKSSKTYYTAAMLADVIDIATLAIKLSDVKTTKTIQNGTAQIISKTSILYEKYIREKLSKKPGLVRKHINGTRSHFTFRSVITALSNDYDYDEIHIPWVVGPTTFRPHVLNKLLRSGYRYRDASEKIFRACQRYDENIDHVLKDLVKESPYKGIPTFAHRNPSLLMGSIILVYATRFKTDIYDQTTNISPLIIKSQNGDYDGKLINVLSVA